MEDRKVREKVDGREGEWSRRKEQRVEEREERKKWRREKEY